jgi:hypothetical protein
MCGRPGLFHKGIGYESFGIFCFRGCANTHENADASFSDGSEWQDGSAVHLISRSLHRTSLSVAFPVEQFLPHRLHVLIVHGSVPLAPGLHGAPVLLFFPGPQVLTLARFLFDVVGFCVDMIQRKRTEASELLLNWLDRGVKFNDSNK